MTTESSASFKMAELSLWPAISMYYLLHLILTLPFIPLIASLASSTRLYLMKVKPRGLSDCLCFGENTRKEIINDNTKKYKHCEILTILYFSIFFKHYL